MPFVFRAYNICHYKPGNYLLKEFRDYLNASTRNSFIICINISFFKPQR